MEKGKIFFLQTVLVLLCFTLIIGIGGCGSKNPSKEELAEIIKTSSANGTIMVGMSFVVEKFNSVEVIDIYNKDTDIESVIPSDSFIGKNYDFKTFQDLLNSANYKNWLLVRCKVTGKVIPSMKKMMPGVPSLFKLPPELSWNGDTTIWMVVMQKKDGKWICGEQLLANE